MFLADTHIHHYLPEFSQDRETLIEQAINDGINKFYLPNIDSTSADSMIQLSQKYPEHCFPMMGLHPCSVKNDFEEELKIAENYFAKETFYGIGEIGLDLFWDKTFFEQQQQAFIIQCQWAVQKNLPVIIHSRNAFEECVAILEKMSPMPRGIFHCFSGHAEQARKAIDLGFYLGIGGVLTFKNSGLDKVITDIELKHLVLETDAPYLAPAPYRGKRNVPAYLKLVAEKLALVKNCSIEKVAEITSQNALTIMGR